MLQAPDFNLLALVFASSSNETFPRAVPTVSVWAQYVCMVITYSKSKDQLGKVDNPVRGQLNGEIE